MTIGAAGLVGRLISQASTPIAPAVGQASVSIRDVLTKGLPAVEQGSVLRTLDRLPFARANILEAFGDWIDRAKDALASLPSDAANALADSMRGPSARQLTPGEVAALQEAFGTSIDLSNVRIVDGPGYNPDAAVAFGIGGNPAITEGNTVYVRHDQYASDFSSSPAGVNTLVHEFTHVRQYQ